MCFISKVNFELNEMGSGVLISVKILGFKFRRYIAEIKSMEITKGGAK
jgi:hypothetical protein